MADKKGGNPVVGFLFRLFGALLVVLATYNPSGISFFHWVFEDTESRISVKVFFGLLLLIGYVIYLRATWRSLGSIGVGISLALLATIVWLLVDFGLFTLSDPGAIAWVALIMISFVMAIGMSWSHVRRRFSGQVDVDETDD